MKSLMTFFFLMPMIFATAPSRAQSGGVQAAPAAEIERMPGGYPQPGPNPRYCPEGTHRVYDEYAQRYICVKNDAGVIDPLPWPHQKECPKGMHWIHGICEYVDGPSKPDWIRRMNSLSEVLGSGDMDALAGFFDAAKSRNGAKSTKSIFKKVADEQEWGGSTGNPPRIPRLIPPRQDPPRQDPPRQDPPRQDPPRLPPTVIPTNPGTIRPA